MNNELLDVVNEAKDVCNIVEFPLDELNGLIYSVIEMLEGMEKTSRQEMLLDELSYVFKTLTIGDTIIHINNLMEEIELTLK